MYPHIRIFYILTILLSISFLTSGQSRFSTFDNLPGVNKSYKPAYSADYPDWAKMMYQKDINFNTVNAEFESYIKLNPGERSAIIRYYKIWRRACESYVAPDGTLHLPDLTQYYENQKKGQLAYKSKSPKATNSNANWTFLGPKETYWLNESGSATAPLPSAYQANVYSFDVAASNNDILYCGTETGYVNKTIDKGLHWTLLGQDYYFGGAVTAVAINPTNPDIVYVAAGNQVHKTIDGGLNWTPLLQTSNLFYADRLRLDPSNMARLYAASASGLYMTSDSGASWSQKWSDPVYDIEIKPNDSSIIYALTKANGNFAMIQSTDGGQTFLIQSSFPSTYAESSGGLLAVSPANPEMLMAVLLSANNIPYLLKGTNAGTMNWSLLATGQTGSLGLNNGQGYFDLVLDVSPLNENIILVGTTTLYKSTNGGATFSAIGGYTGNFKIHPDQQDIKMLASGETWVSTDGGMNLTTDNFASVLNHKIRINGLIGSDMWGFDQGWNEDLIVGGRYHNGNTAMADFYQPKALRMGGAESPTGWVIHGRSRQVAFNDLGNGWTLPLTAEGPPQGRFIFSKYPNMEEYGGRRGNMVFHPNYYGTIYLGEGSGFWKSTDRGISWDLLHDFPSTVRYLQISQSNPNVIYADVLDNGLYKSTDGGMSWTLKPALTAAPNGSAYWKGKLFFAISPYDENMIYACLQNGSWSSDIGKIFRSGNGGNSWEDWTGSLDEYMKCIVVQPSASGEDLVYLFTNANNGKPGSVYYRKPAMGNWVAFDENYPASMGVNLALPFYRDSKLRVAGNGGVWESPMQEEEFFPILNPWIEKAHYNCMLDTLYLEDHSILNHSGTTWHWDISPTPSYISDPNARNPKVVLGSPGSFNLHYSVTVNGLLFEKTLNNFVSATTCPSIDDCSNPAEIPKNIWVLKYADSQEINYPGLATMSFDNDPNTIWHTAWSTGDVPYPHEIQIDLGQSYRIYSFTYLTRQDGANGRIKDYELYISDDSLNWGSPVHIGQFVNTSAPQTVVLDSSVTGHYFRLKALSEVNASPWASAAEFSFVGCKNAIGIHDYIAEDSSIHAFPVPTNGIVSITMPKGTHFKYRMISSLSQELERGEIKDAGTHYSFNLCERKPGMYFLILSDENEITYRVKIIKK
ncbi:MAG: discoidin domain-containing protein [Bacteroidota bacterium]